MGSRLLQLELLLPHEFAFSAPFCQTALTPSKSRKQFRELEIPWHSVKVVRIWFLSLPINWCCEKARCQFKYQPIEVLPGANKEGSSPVLPAVAAPISPRHTWVSASAYFWPCALFPFSLGCVLPSVKVDYYELQSQWVEARDLRCIDELSFMIQMRVLGSCKPKPLDAVDKMIVEQFSHVTNVGASHLRNEEALFDLYSGQLRNCITGSGNSRSNCAQFVPYGWHQNSLL